MAWRLRGPLAAMPSYVVSYSSKNVTSPAVTIVGRALVVAVSVSVLIVRTVCVLVTRSVRVVVRSPFVTVAS